MMLSPAYIQHQLNWHGRSLTIRHCRNWPGKLFTDLYGRELTHVTISSDDKQPLPISKTGYKSLFLDSAELCDDPVEYIRWLLDQIA